MQGKLPNRRSIIGLLALLVSCWPSGARAVVEIRLDNPQISPAVLAVTRFNDAEGRPSVLGANIAKVLEGDLVRTGLFVARDAKDFIARNESIDERPNFPSWKLIGAQLLIQGRIAPVSNGQISISFRLWDTYSEQQMDARAFVSVHEHWRRVAHIIADAVFSRVTGEKGMFDSRIVYIAESGPPLNRIKRLAIMDQDGANHRFLTDGQSLVLTPRFSPASQQIAYLSYFRDMPRVYLFDLESGRQELLGDFPGMTFSPRFSPRGNRVIMSVAQDGNSDIFVLDLRSRSVQRLTSHPSIDISPDYSPDGETIVFNSDRSGSQQLYTMDRRGNKVRRISFDKGRFGTPVWSPRGDLIAFTRLYKRNFQIGVMRPDGSRMRILDTGYLVEGPSWSPNGRFVTFFEQSRPDKDSVYQTWLRIIDLTGRSNRRIPTPVDGSDPAWSPLLR